MSCHNGEKYLKMAIHSVLKQSYNNWELIFWDNFSNDDSAKIINSFADNRIKYFKSKKKTNLAIARNKAIQKSKGEFICFLDTDDYWLKDKLKIQINTIKSNALISVVFCKYYILNEKLNKLSKHSNMDAINYNKLGGLIFYELLNKYIDGKPLLGPLSVMIRKKILDKIVFDTNLHVFADFELFLKLSETRNFQGINSYLAVYRLHDSNESFQSLKKYNIEYSHWFSKIKNNSIYNNFNNFNKIIEQINYQKILIHKENRNYLKAIKIFWKIKKIKNIIKILLNMMLPRSLVKAFRRT